MIPTPVSARERIFTPRSRSSQMLLMVSGQRRPMRSMATTTRVSPPARRASRRCHPRRSWVPVEPETPTSRNRFSQGTAAPEGWSSLGRWVHPQDPLLEPAAGADIAVDWCQDRSWSLQLAFMEQLPQRGSCSANRVFHTPRLRNITIPIQGYRVPTTRHPSTEWAFPQAVDLKPNRSCRIIFGHLIGAEP